ncbi:hypothetical protein [Ascidiimonas sp. W6]|uniref:hypothetical protein n=1 Tax=Ascidiimonas meishanensis TaxID=3128903 RepID=UPI0030ED79BF
MKILNYFTCLILLSFLIALTSCQSEVNVSSLDTQPEREPIQANSVTAQAMMKAASLDGSKDNIIDGASCLTIVYPINVTVNGIPVEILSENDLITVEGIFDSDIEDVDLLEIDYPITVINNNFNQIIINNVAELQLNANTCVEGGDDIDNECIDFVYPITFFVFNTTTEITSQVQVTKDRDMFIFTEGIEEDEVVSLKYPVSLVLLEGDIITVNSNQELTTAISGVEDDCDEDDDNNFNDDDFKDGELESLLVECLWKISRFKRDGSVQPFTNWTVEFDANGDVVILDPLKIIGIDGTWTTRFTEEGSFVDLDMNGVVAFSLQWQVNKVDGNTIYIFSSTGSFLELNQECSDGGSGSAEGILEDKAWSIGLLQTPSPGDQSDYVGIPLTFKTAGVVTLRIKGVEEEGSWQYLESEEEEEMDILRITFSGQPSLNQAWDVESIENNEIRLKKGNTNRLELIKVDENENESRLENLQSVITSDSWEVDSFTEDGSDNTSVFENYSFTFAANGLTIAEESGNNSEGSWLSYVSDNSVIVEINFENNGSLKSLNERWKLLVADDDIIQLEVTRDGVTKTIIFGD